MKVYKKICFFCLNVVASLQRAIRIDALVETFKLDKPPLRDKARFIKSIYTKFVKYQINLF